MAGPVTKRTIDAPLGVVESEQTFMPGALAEVVENLVRTSEGTLRPVRGPVVYEAKDNLNGDRVYGVFQAVLNGLPTLLVRAGTKMYRHEGWARSWVVVRSGLTELHGSNAPDQWAVVNSRVIWCNGTDRPLVIDSDGRVDYLGFAVAPGQPVVHGPMQPPNSQTEYPNSNGFSWWGRIGTLADQLLGDGGSLLSGARHYRVQYESSHGDLSPMSPPVVLSWAALYPQTAENGRPWVNPLENWTDRPLFADDMTMQFVVQAISDAPEQVEAIRLLATRDAKRNDPGTYYLLVRHPSRRAFMYPDNVRDDELVDVQPETVPTPLFHLCVPYGGGLAVAEHNRVWLSDPNFAGTYQKNRWIIPDVRGARVTALAIFGGSLLAFTRSSVFLLIDDPEGLRARPVSGTIGCVAPDSLAVGGDGALIWLAADGFYAMTETQAGPSIERISDPIQRSISGLNRGAMIKATAVYDPEAREYLCWVTDGDENFNRKCHAFGGLGWRRLDLGVRVAQAVLTDDARRYVLLGGERVLGPSSQAVDQRVFVYDHENRGYAEPLLTYTYETAWLRADAAGRREFTLKGVLFGLIDACDVAVRVDIFKNGVLDPYLSYTGATGLIPAPPTRSGVTDEQHLGSATVNTTKARRRRLFWRKLSVAAFSCRSFKVRITATKPNYFHLAQLGFEVATSDVGEARLTPQNAP